MLTTQVQFFAKKRSFLLNTDNFTMDLIILLIPIARCCLLTIYSVHLYCCGCHGKQFDTTWKVQRKFIICVKYQVNRIYGVKSGGDGTDLPLSPSPPLMPSSNSVRLIPSSVNTWAGAELQAAKNRKSKSFSFTFLYVSCFFNKDFV